MKLKQTKNSTSTRVLHAVPLTLSGPPSRLASRPDQKIIGAPPVPSVGVPSPASWSSVLFLLWGFHFSFSICFTTVASFSSKKLLTTQQSATLIPLRRCELEEPGTR
ncbi:hypothetical protein T439DRAFT_198081 [Meredithblackwellia eburnea MCA 4105]